MTPERCRGLFDIVCREARAHGVSDVEMIVGDGEHALTRFANNTIHQNVAERGASVSIRPQEDQKTARADTNRLDESSLRQTVRDAIAIMRARDPDPTLLPLAEPEAVNPALRSFPATAACTPSQRAKSVVEAIAVAEQSGQNAAGAFSTASGAETLMNSRGVFLHHPQTMATFSVTVMEDSSSGWAKQSVPDLAQLDPVALAHSASRKAILSRHPRELPPGRFTVILEPAAVLDLVGQLIGDFSATALEDQRSFLTGRLGEQVFGPNINIRDDAHHALQSGEPFDGEGLARRPLTLVEGGRPVALCYSRAAAARAGTAPTGHGLPLPNEIGEYPMNIVIAGGDASVDQMIRQTRRGILVTRLWYIREVDPYEKIMTGMTRDGTFLVENGEIAGGIRNFRFNQSLVEMLNRVELLGPAVRASGEEAMDMVVPPMLVHDFQFTEVTRC